VLRQPYPSAKPYNNLYLEYIAASDQFVSNLVLLMADVNLIASASRVGSLPGADVTLFAGPKRPNVKLF
jgi:hypothetical protein